MRSLRITLAGIALILFGMAFAMFDTMYGIGEAAEIVSVFSVLAGIITALIGGFGRD